MPDCWKSRITAKRAVGSMCNVNTNLENAIAERIKKFSMRLLAFFRARSIAVVDFDRNGLPSLSSLPMIKPL